MIASFSIFGLFGGAKPPLAMECGACGRAARRGASRCEHCGVEFEPDVAKCSHCASWIPASVEKCPKCNSAFGTFRTEWGMHGYDRPIRLPRVRTPEELEFELPPASASHPAAASPRVVGDPDEGPVEHALDAIMDRDRLLNRASDGLNPVCPNCGGSAIGKDGSQKMCLVCKTHWD